MGRRVESADRTPRRWKRRLAIGLAVMVLFLLAGLWQLPWLLGTAPGRAFIASKISAGSRRITIDSLDLSWSGEQAVRGLRIRDAQGREVANVSAAFRGSLWSWATGSRDFGAVVLAGNVTVYESPPAGEPKRGGGKAPSTGTPGAPADILIPEGVKAALQLDALSVTYVPLPGSGQPAMAVRDVTGALTVDGRSPATLKLAGTTEIGTSRGSFAVDASVSGFAAADGSLQTDKAKFEAEISGENLPVPIVERMIGEHGRLTALLGESVNLTINATGGMIGGKAALTAESPRFAAAFAATVDAQRRLTLTQGQATLAADQRTLEALLSAEQRAGLALTKQATATLSISRFTAQLPVADQPLDISSASLDAILSIAAASIDTGREDLTAAELRELAVQVSSDDPTKEIRIKAGGAVTSQLAGQPQPITAPVKADLALVRAFTADGAWSSETLGIAGTVRTQDVPTSLIDVLAGAEGWIVDAAGPMVARAELTAEADAGAGNATMIGAALSAPQVQASARLRMAEGRVASIEGQPIEASLTVSPAMRNRLAVLLARSSPQMQLDEGGRATLRLTSLSMSIPGESSPESWKTAAIEGSLMLQNARGTYLPSPAEGEEALPPRRYDIETFTADFRTASARDTIAVDVKASLRQDGVPLALRARAEVAAAFDADKRQMTVETEETTVPLEVITAWSGEQAEVVSEALGGPVVLTLNAMHFAGGVSANAKVRGERTDAQLTYAMQNERTLFELRGAQRATPALVAALLGSERVAVLAEPADLTFVLATPAQSAAGAEFNDWPLKLDASTRRAVFSGLKGVPGLLTAVNVQLDADWPAGLSSAGRYILAGELSDGLSTVAGISADASYTIGGDWMKSRGRIEIKQIDVASLERTLALESGVLTAWLGGKGALEVGSVLDAGGRLTDDLLVAAQFDRASGRIAGRIAEDRLIVNTPGTVKTRVEQARLGQLLNKWTGAIEAKDAARLWTAREDADLGATIRSISLPLAALSGEEYDPRLFSIDADVSVPRLALRQGGTDISLAETLLKISGKSLAEGMALNFKSTTQTGAGPAAGGIDLSGLVKAATFRPEDRRYSLSGTMRGVPVAIVDALARLDGQLVAAVGSSMDMQLNLAEAHRNGGTLSASITTANGTLAVPKADLRDNTLVVEAANPASASLEVTPEMSTTLLSNVNPLLYDVRKKAGPIAFNASRLVLPLDGDVSKLGGQFTLDLGQLYVPTKGILGEFLGQLKPKTDQSEPDRVETTIPPITGRINKGVLEYDKFIMQSQAFEITTSGKVDLVKRRLDLLASVPLIGWKSVFADMTKIAPAFLTDIPVNVPFYLVVRGPIDKPEIKPDPKGAQRVADEFFRGIGENLIDNVFDNIFRPRR